VNNNGFDTKTKETLNLAPDPEVKIENVRAFDVLELTKMNIL
jgi:hypothetical protein